MFASVIEWDADEGLAPTLFVSDDADELVLLTARRFATLDAESFLDERTFLDDHPLPDDVDGCRQWLADMREATTVPWVEFFALPGFDGEADQLSLYDFLGKTPVS